MVTRLGTVLGTQLGTDLGAFVENPPVPTFDASKVYALTGPSAADYFRAAIGGGEAGDITAGFGGATLCQPIAATANSSAHARWESATAGGWRHWLFNPGSGTALRASAVNSTPAEVVSPTRLLTPSDYGKVMCSAFQHTGSMLRLYADRAEIGSGTAITGYLPSANARHQFGPFATTSEWLRDLAGVTWRGTPTLLQLQALFDAVRALGDFPQKAAIEALMAVRYGMNGMTAANFAQTAINAGIAGAASGFHVFARVRFDALTGTEVFLGRDNFGNAGWRIGRSTGTLTATFTNGAGAQINATSLNVSAYLGRTAHIAAVHTGSAVQLWVDGVQIGPDVAITGFTPYVGGRMAVGTVSATYPSPGTSVFEISGGHSVPTAAEIAQAAAAENTGMPVIVGKTEHAWRLHQDIAANGNAIPATFLDRVGTDHLATVGTPTVAQFGATVTHRWSLRDVLQQANVPVIDAQAAPASIPDSVTGAGVDAMAKVGSPTIKVIDPTPKLWSYETTPILYGAGALDLSNYYDCATPLGEGTSSFWTAMFFTVASQAVASKSRVPFGSSSSAPANISGFAMGTSGTNTFAFMTAYNGLGAGISSPSATIAATDVGKLHLLVAVLDAPAGKVRTYWKRAEVGTGTSYTVYSPSSSGMRLGRTYLANDYSPDGVQLWGVAAGVGLPTLAQVQGMFDQTQATERIGSIAGMTSMRIDLTQDALGNGAVMPATLTDRVGSFNFTRTGAVTTSAAYARAFGW